MPQDDKLPELDEFEQRINDARPELDKREGASADEAHKLSLGMRLGIELVAATAVGGGLGYFLDSWLGTTPWLLMIGFFLGCAAGFRNLKRSMEPYDDNDA